MATPTINAVSGLIQSGQILNVSGLNLINEDTSGYDPDFDVDQFNFSGASWAADGFVNSNFVYDNSIKLIGNNAPKSETAYSGENSHGVGAGTGRTSLSAVAGRHFVSMYVREDFSFGNGTWPTIQQKIFNNYQNQGLSDPSYNVNWQADAEGGAYTGLIIIFNPGDTTHSSGGSTGLSFTHQQNTWNHIEVDVPGSSPGTFRVYLNGDLAIEEDYGSDPQMSPNDTELVINTQSGDSGFGIRQWIDGFRVSSTRIRPFSKYEIGDSPVYATANKVYQYPNYLSDTAASINCDLTGLTGGDYYLFGTNQRGEVSIGYSLSGVAPASVIWNQFSGRAGNDSGVSILVHPV